MWIKKCLALFPLSLLSLPSQVQLLPREGASELNGAIRESLPLYPIQPETFLPWVTSQTPHIPVLQPTVDACVLVAYHERVVVWWTVMRMTMMTIMMMMMKTRNYHHTKQRTLFHLALVQEWRWWWWRMKRRVQMTRQLLSHCNLEA